MNEKKSIWKFLLLNKLKKCAHDYAKKNKLDITIYQSNIEGELVDKIQESRNNQNGLIINAGGYTHTSVAIHDALAANQNSL